MKWIQWLLARLRARSRKSRSEGKKTASEKDKPSVEQRETQKRGASSKSPIKKVPRRVKNWALVVLIVVSLAEKVIDASDKLPPLVKRIVLAILKFVGEICRALVEG